MTSARPRPLAGSRQLRRIIPRVGQLADGTVPADTQDRHSNPDQSAPRSACAQPPPTKADPVLAGSGFPRSKATTCHTKEDEMTRAGELFTYDAQFEDMALRTHIRGQAAITRYLQRALPDLPYPRASIRHVVGAGQGGGFEWHSAGRAVPRGAAALELSKDGKITKFTVVWDGSLLDDTTITAAAAHALDR